MLHFKSQFIFNMQGQIVYNAYTKAKFINVDEAFEAGLYFVKVVGTNKKVASQKLIVR